MLGIEPHQHGGTWIFYVIVPVILGGAVACLWWVVRERLLASDSIDTQDESLVRGGEMWLG